MLTIIGLLITLIGIGAILTQAGIVTDQDQIDVKSCIITIVYSSLMVITGMLLLTF